MTERTQTAAASAVVMLVVVLVGRPFEWPERIIWQFATGAALFVAYCWALELRNRARRRRRNQAALKRYEEGQ